MDYLRAGLEHGFDTLVSDINLQTKECKNLLTARENPSIVQELLDAECTKGYAYGPFSDTPFENYRVSPIGIAIGKYSGKKRLIIDLSSPHKSKLHSSINELIDKDQCTLSYVRIDDALNKICEFGKGAILCKFDIKDAFKHCPIRKDQWHLFLVRWNGMYYVMTRLAFGCRSSPRIFDNLAQALCWIASNNYNIRCIFHPLDDVLTIDLPSSNGESTFSTMMYIFNSLCVPLSENKLAGPCTCLEYLGIILDSDKMQCRLPADKVERIMNFIKELLSKRSCTKRELLQLLGHMNFASRVILAGRAFVSYLQTNEKKDRYRDARLNRSLSIEEFIVAFNKYKRIHCTRHPWRKAELDEYEANIIDISRVYGRKFYEYHKIFSQKCAVALEQGKKVNWGEKDKDLMQMIIGGTQCNSCNICKEVSHTTQFCPQNFSQFGVYSIRTHLHSYRPLTVRRLCRGNQLYAIFSTVLAVRKTNVIICTYARPAILYLTARDNVPRSKFLL